MPLAGADAQLTDPLGPCNGCNSLHDRCRCANLIEIFASTNRLLANMNLIERLAGFTITALIEEQIVDWIKTKCVHKFDVTHLTSIEMWLDHVVIRWLTQIYGHYEDRALVRMFKTRLTTFMNETYAKLIIEQFFNIIVGKRRTNECMNERTVRDRVTIFTIWFGL